MKKPVVFIIMLMLIFPVAALSNGTSDILILTVPNAAPSNGTSESSFWVEEGNSDFWEEGNADFSEEGELIYHYDMSAKDISEYIRGKIFQEGSYSMASGIGEIIYFTPEGNEYFWFCSSMDAQSRIRAEYGIWKLKDGYMTTTAQKFVEWVDGYFTAANGSVGTRYILEDYNEILTDVNIKNESNFHMFEFRLYDEDPELGFYWEGAEYYYFPSCGGYETIREDYDRYFTLFGK